MRTARRASLATLALALGLGFALRLWGIGFGFPLLVHADEGVIVQNAAGAGAGRLDPGWYVQGPLASWLLAALWGVRFTALRVIGAIAGTDAYKDAFLTDPTPFYLWGRAALGALLGTVSIWTTWRIGREALGRPVAALGAFLFAVSFLAVRDAHFIYVDMGMLACATLCAACWLRYARTGTSRPLLLGAVACGAAAAFKYNAALIGLLLVAVVLTGRPRRWGHLVLGTLVTCATLALGNPFLLLNPAGVWADLSAEGAKHGAHPWGHHFTYSLVGGAGWPVALLGALACLAALARGSRRERLLWLVPLLWYAYATRHALAYARYVLPILPFACLGAAQVLARAIPRGRRRLLLPLAVLLVAAPTAAKSILFDRLLARPDARVELARWLRTAPEVPDGARLALDHTFWTTGALPTWAFGRTDAQLAGMEATAQTDAQRDRLRRLRTIGERPGG
ncbi:MAG: glycosyltransferase family 39 protein, partial [Planctomycetes bacterium]|nr:glycosyltransferase family 39 protein [Planctomycetota bacterium]